MSNTTSDAAVARAAHELAIEVEELQAKHIEEPIAAALAEMRLATARECAEIGVQFRCDGLRDVTNTIEEIRLRFGLEGL